MNKEEIKDRLRGQWEPVLLALSAIPADCLNKHHQPCPKCGGTKRFNYERKKGDGGIYCNDCKPEGTGDGFGTLEWFNGWDFSRAIREVENHIEPSKQTGLPAHVRKLRHDVYSRILSAPKCRLSEKQQADLLARGLTAEEIEHRGYAAVATSASLVVAAIPAEERKAIAENVPGVFPGGAIRFNASQCLLIPVRDEFGNIIAMQYRPNEVKPGSAKYRWLSSKSKVTDSDRPSPGAPAHFALAPKGKWFDGRTVRITEGPLKADVATAISGVQTIAVAGANIWRVAASAVELLNPAVVLIAFDMDRYSNPAVAKATVELYEHLASRFDVRIEKWNADCKGIDDVLASGGQTEVLTADQTRGDIERLKAIASGANKKKRLKNYKLVKSESDDPNQAWEKQPLPIPEIAKDLTEIREGWPKACRGVLFVPDAQGRVRELKQSAELFGWIGVLSPVDFNHKNGCIGKQEFFAELPQHVEQFEDTEYQPHFPPIERHFYCKKVQPGDGKHLERFLDFFNPATDTDRELILAFIVTTFWGGEYGRRVAFGIDSTDGTGAGKSELVKRIAKLTGGHYEIETKKIDEIELRKKLVNGEKHRVVLLDNIKESCVSSAAIESMITADMIGGHKLNVGYTSRPNTLTWSMTMNGMALSRDLAQRTVVIKLCKPSRDGNWEELIGTFTKENHEKIIADIAAFFDRQPVALANYSRWASWEKEVLARLPNPLACQELIRQRRELVDEDHHTAEAIRDFFANELQELGYDPTSQKIHIPSRVMTEWLEEATGKEFGKRSSNAQVKNLIDGGSLKNLQVNPSRKYGRGWIWNALLEGEVIYTLQKTFESKKRREELF